MADDLGGELESQYKQAMPKRFLSDWKMSLEPLLEGKGSEGH